MDHIQPASNPDVTDHSLVNKLNEIIAAVNTLLAGGGGASTYIELTDTDNSYAGFGQYLPVVNGAEDGLAFGAQFLNAIPDPITVGTVASGGQSLFNNASGGFTMGASYTGAISLFNGSNSTSVTAFNNANGNVAIAQGIAGNLSLGAGAELTTLGGTLVNVTSANAAGFDNVISSPSGGVVIWSDDGTNTSVALQHNGSDVLVVDENGLHIEDATWPSANAPGSLNNNGAGVLTWELPPVAAFVDPSMATAESIANALIAAGLMESE